MEDSEVLLKNDPLATYIQNLNIPFEFDIQENTIKNESETPKSSFKRKMDNIEYKLYQFQIYRGYILSSQLMFSDDNALVLACSESTNTSSVKSSRTSWFLIPISGAIALFSKSKITTIVSGSICLINSLYVTYIFMKQRNVKSIIYNLIQTLKHFTESMKKYLWNIIQYTTTLNYYSDSSNKSTINSNLNEHVKTFCNTLYEIALKLREKSGDFVNCIQLSFEIENLELIEIPEDLKAKHAKILYEYYLLVQSHFLKVVALIFIPDLWVSAKNEDNFSIVFHEIKEITNFMSNQMKILKTKHDMFLRVGECKALPNIVNSVQDKMCATLLTNLQLAEINLHQLLCKIRFLQEVINKDSSENEIADLYTRVGIAIEEIQKQIDNPKHYVNAASIILQRCLNAQIDVQVHDQSPEEKNELKEPNKDLVTINPSDPEPPRSNEIYELFIPKEGLPPVENSQIEDPLLPYNNKTYSTTLLQELKQLLKERNPDIATEQEENKKLVGEEKDEPDKVEIFRPQKPVGLFVNQSLQDILAMRKTIQDEEEFIDDTYSGDDDQE